jgi:UDP-3-O-[3-hydroxymyristoyl] glucosamine N-acyltransferase
VATTNEYNQERHEFALERLESNEIEAQGAIKFTRGMKIYTTGIHRSADIGDGTIVRPGATIGPNVVIGRNCLIKAGARIGERGFSYGFSEENTPIPFAHTGRVIIGDNVQIGSGTTVCRATVDATIIEDHVQLDDLVHVAHDVRIGTKSCIIAGVVLCGSVTIGKCVWVGPNAVILNSLHVADYTLVGAMANVTKEFEPGDILVGNPAKAIRNRLNERDFPNAAIGIHS